MTVTVRQFRQRYAFGRSSPIAFPSSTSPGRVGRENPETSSDQNTGPLLERYPSSIGLPHAGHSTGNPPSRKTKNALPLNSETKRLKTLCGTTLAAAPLRETAPHSPLPRADAVTGINRPRLLASSFSRRLQGDFRRSSRPPCTKRRLSVREREGLLVLIRAYVGICPIILSASRGNVKEKVEGAGGISPQSSRKFNSFFHKSVIY